MAEEFVSGQAYAAGRASSIDASDDGAPQASDVEDAYICVTCGVQFAPTAGPPERCPVCEDERQFVGWSGQRWATMDQLRERGHRTEFHEEEPGLESVDTVPAVAIGQRALLVHTPNGNVLWDCLSYIDDDTVRAIESRGPLRAIAISHPHFYSAMAMWSEALDVPVYVHEADRQWVTYEPKQIEYWTGETHTLMPDVTLINCGGHFPGSSALHWAAGAGGKGVLLSGDTVKPVMDRRFVAFMYSIVNLIPASPTEVRTIAERLGRFEFERIYSLWRGHMVATDGSGAVRRSAERYLRHVEEIPDDEPVRL